MRSVRTRGVSARRVVRAGWLLLIVAALLCALRAAPVRAQAGGTITVYPTTATTGTPTPFYGVVTAGGTFYTSSWTFSDTNTPTTGTASGSTLQVTHTFVSAGTFTVTVTATGTTGTAFGYGTVTVSGTGGTSGQITITPTPSNPAVGGSVTFIAQLPVQALSATAIWSFGDPNSGASNTYQTTVSSTTVTTATHTYVSAGTDAVSLTVTGTAIGGSPFTYTGGTTVVVGGGTGGTGGTTGAFQVSAGNGSYLGIVGTPVFFSGFAQCNNNGSPCSGNFAYNWTFSDGTSSGPSTANRTYSKTFNSAGNYTATLSVTDQTYNSTGSASEPVCISAAGSTTTGNCTSGTTGGTGGTTGSGQVTSNGITANPGGPYTGSSGTAITFNGTATSTNSGGQIVSYVWSFGDGSSGSGQSTTHTYNSSGNFTVALTVTDSAGITVTATTTANIGAGQRKINLPQGCTNLASTFPDNTSTGTIVSNVSPTSAVLSVWEYNSAQAKFQGYLPGATQATDLPTVNHLDAIFICVNAPATFTEPSA